MLARDGAGMNSEETLWKNAIGYDGNRSLKSL